MKLIMPSPAPLPHTSEHVLEFNDFRQLLAAYTASPLGRERVLKLEPSQDRGWIECQQQLTEELRGYLRTGGSFDFHGLLDPTLLLDKSRIRGAVLELSEIRDILLLADRAAEWREIALHPTVQVQENWQEVTALSQ
jgi:DNA mismatch repair protein MutS2